MPGNEIEWDDIDDVYDSPDTSSDEPVDDAALRSTLPLMTVAGGLQLVAAVLSVVAPFFAIWTLRGRDAVLQAAGTSSEISTNGWGTPSLASNGQGPVYGVILVLAALPLLLAALLRVREVMLVRAGTADTTAWMTDPARALGVAGSALLLGGAGALLLVAINLVGNEDKLGISSAEVSIGAGTWLALAGWVASVVALAISEQVHRRLRWQADEAKTLAAIAALDEADDSTDLRG